LLPPIAVFYEFADIPEGRSAGLDVGADTLCGFFKRFGAGDGDSFLGFVVVEGYKIALRDVESSAERFRKGDLALGGDCGRVHLIPFFYFRIWI